MNVLFVVSEVEPFAKTGGLADVASALPKALHALGHDVRVALPLYRQVDRARCGLRATPITVAVRVGLRALEGRVWEARLPGSGVTAYLIECAPLFDRDGLYQDGGTDYPDNLQRFSFFSQAALRMLPALRWRPDLVHCHDWQAALACAHLRFAPMGREPFFSSMGTVFTVHNLAYQGVFPRAQWPLTGLPEEAFTAEGLEFHRQLSCLKGALVSAGRLTTVSPTYSREIRTPAFGCGLEEVLAARRGDLDGILNGVDQEAWDPQTDPHLAARYSAQHPAGKAQCKQALQHSQRLPETPGLLIGMIQRLAEQKGIDLLVQAMDALMALPIQIVLLGSGDPAYHRQLTQLAERFPQRFAVTRAFNEPLAHQIEAGADAFLMPSRFEPCGLNQMYSMRFGTVPIVRGVGGLTDTVADLTPETRTAGTATGFVIPAHTARSLVETVQRAVEAFGDRALWASLMQAGMRRDCSWAPSARAYAQVYERAVSKGARGRRV